MCTRRKTLSGYFADRSGVWVNSTRNLVLQSRVALPLQRASRRSSRRRSPTRARIRSARSSRHEHPSSGIIETTLRRGNSTMLPQWFGHALKYLGDLVVFAAVLAAVLGETRFQNGQGLRSITIRLGR